MSDLLGQYTSFYYERLELRMCYVCGAVVKNERTHTEWHTKGREA
jgi:hypothetical protein